jgi:chromosome segregation ATPase
MSEVLAVEEVPKKLGEFRDLWYSIAQKCEALSRHRTGLEGEFQSELSAVLRNVRELEALLDDIAISTQMHIPKVRDEIEGIRTSFMASLRELESVIDGDLKTLEKYTELSPRFEEVSKNLQNLIERHEDLKSYASRTCDQYSQLKDEYERKISNIRAATDRELEKIKGKFISEVSSMFEGYYIVSKAQKEELSLDLLLERLIQDPNYYQKVDVMHRGLFGRKRSDIETRLVLLQYKAEEMSEAIRPILDEEKRRISKFEGEEKRISDLGIQCRELREEEKALASKRESLERDVGKLETEISDIREELGNYSKLARHVDSYVKKFGETTSVRNKLADIIESSFAAYEPVEKDVEKRELRAELKTLRDEVRSLEQAKEKLKRDLGKANQLVEEHETRIGKLRKDLDEARSKLGELDETLRSVTREKEQLENEVKSLRDALSSKEKDVEELGEQVASLSTYKASLEEEVRGLKSELSRVSKELRAAGEENRKLSAKYKELEGNYNSINFQYREATSQLAVSKAKAEGLEKKLKETMKEKASIEKDLRIKERELIKIESKAERLAKKLEDSKAKLLRYKSKLSETSKKLTAESKEHSALKTEHTKLLHELKKVRSEVERLEKEIAIHIKATGGVRIKKARATGSKARKKEYEGKFYGKALKGEEEVVVGEKISALRKKK